MSLGFILPTHEEMVENILNTWSAATPEQAAGGAQWFTEAHALALVLTPTDVEKGAGIIAALSPAISWTANVRVAIVAVKNRPRKPAGVLGASWAKARRINRGELPLDVLGGAKVRAFFTCIATNGLDARAVCVDRHAAAIAVGTFLADGGAAAVRGFRYEAIADAYRAAAARVDVSPATMQAVTWVVWRATPWRQRPSA